MNTREELHALVDALHSDSLDAAHCQLETVRRSYADPPPDVTVCTTWPQLVAELEQFPMEPEKWTAAADGDPVAENDRWAFRGHSNSDWDLEPSVERLGFGVDWESAERDMMRDFKAKAHLYSASVPSGGHESEIEWRSFMQHHGLPTRLLDFTYSPYVATYFAIRDESPGVRFAAVWALELNRLGEAADAVYSALPDIKDRQGLITMPRRPYSELALYPRLADQTVFNKRGFVVPVLPRAENKQLSSQQGLFLLNGAPQKTFCKSLSAMMSGERSTWCRRIYIDQHLRPEALRRLLRMNVHELSLFPSLEGLARYAVRKAELLALRETGDNI